VRYNLARTWLTCSQARTIALAFPDDTNAIASSSGGSSSSSKHGSVAVGASRTNSFTDAVTAAAAAAAAAVGVGSSTRSSLSGIAEGASTSANTTAAAGSKPQKKDSLNNNNNNPTNANTSSTNNTASNKLREDVVVAAFSRVTDSSNFDAVLNTLSPAGQLSAARRLGWLNALNPDRIDRPFDLDLRNSDHRRLVEVLTELAITEPGECCCNQCLQYMNVFLSLVCRLLQLFNQYSTLITETVTLVEIASIC
jgi:hypothetical protein